MCVRVSHCVIIVMYFTTPTQKPHQNCHRDYSSYIYKLFSKSKGASEEDNDEEGEGGKTSNLMGVGDACLLSFMLHATVFCIVFYFVFLVPEIYCFFLILCHCIFYSVLIVYV